MCEKNSGEGRPSASLKTFCAGAAIDDALVDVHRAAGFARHRLRHERRIHLVTQRRFARRALEQKHLVGERQRIAVQQIDLHLRRAVFMDQRVDLDVLRLAERIHVVEQRIELVDRRDRIRLSADLRTARAADRRLQRIVGVDVRLDEKELEFRRHHRLPAVLSVQLQNVLQHVARRHRHRASVRIEAVVNDLRRRLGGPRHDANRAWIGLENDVDFRRADGAFVVGIFAGHGLQEDAFRQAHALFFGELRRGHDLAARHARHVGNDRLDFGDAVFFEKLLDDAHTR